MGIRGLVGFSTCLAAAVWNFAAVAQSANHSQSPGWFLEVQSRSADVAEQGGGRKIPPIKGCEADAASFCSASQAGQKRACLLENKSSLSGECRVALDTLAKEALAANGGVPPCAHSPLCSSNLGGTKATLPRVEWKQTMGYAFSYPFVLPTGLDGGVSGVSIDSKGDLWVFQRNKPGQPQLFEFSPTHNLIRTIGENVIGHQYKAHGLAVDSQDDVWI